jgi:hypothetical protein
MADKLGYDTYRERYRDEEKLKYTCIFCGKKYHTKAMADDCCEEEIWFVPLYKADMPYLVQFLYMRDPSILPERLVKTILKYNKLKGE